MPKYLVTSDHYIDGRLIRASIDAPVYVDLAEEVKPHPGLQPVDAKGNPEPQQAKAFLAHPHAALTEEEVETQLTGRLGATNLSPREAAAKQAGAPTPASVPQTKESLQSAGVIDKKGNKRTSDNEPV